MAVEWNRERTGLRSVRISRPCWLTTSGIHWRDGGHAQDKEDWLALLDFADWQFFNKKPARSFSTLTYPDADVPVQWNSP